MKRNLIVLILSAILMLACTANRQALASSDPLAKPSFSSMYLYMAGSLHFFIQDYHNAEILYQRALAKDPHSIKIKSQMLLSAMYGYTPQVSDSTQIKAIINANQKTIYNDLQLLDGAYNVYYWMQDVEGMRWAIDGMMRNFPSSRAHILNFIWHYQQDGIANAELLKPALKLAGQDLQELQHLGQLVDMVDMAMALEVSQRIYALDPDSENADQVAIRLIKMGDDAVSRTYFNTLKYPEDIELIYAILDTAMQVGQHEFINSVARRVISFDSPELTYLVALSALITRNQKVLARVEPTIHPPSIDFPEELYVNALLIANSLLEDDATDIQPLFATLTNTQDLDNIVRFYIFAISSSMQDESMQVPDSVFEDLVVRLRMRLPENMMSSYLITLVQTITETDAAQIEALEQIKEKLILDFQHQDIYSREDVGWLLSRYHQQDRLEERVQLLRLATQLYPEEPVWLNDLGYTLLIRGDDLQEAAELIFAALNLDYENPYYLDSIAYYYYLIGDIPHAHQYIQAAMEMEDMPSEIAYHVALIHYELGEMKTALQYMKKAAAMDDDDKIQKLAQQALVDWEN
ncbi:MAG: hypothetical protein GX122_05910 [Candidatus Cloacimonetes bacterium]|nr:hypothetical protein [Candidatus Cloacimonadota bacterium]NLO11934.1 hypothetical protein [Candidatus Cloacimonadota bacterium]